MKRKGRKMAALLLLFSLLLAGFAGTRAIAAETAVCYLHQAGAGARQKQQKVLRNVRKASKVTGRWVRRRGRYRFRRTDRSYVKDAWANIKGRYYYFDQEGFRTQGFFKYKNGNTYYLDENGVMAAGWRKIGTEMYCFRKNGAMKKSMWIRSKRGNFYYVNRKGRMVKNRWLTIDGKKYYVNKKGARVTHSCYIGNRLCYFDSDGVYDPDREVKERVVNPNGKMVALTFDDGPGPYTDRLLNCLERNQCVATFFLVGRSIPNYKSAVKRMDEIGCEIGNHTWDHPQLTSLPDYGIQTQIDSTNQQIRAITGKKAVLVRPPYGSYNGSVSVNVKAPMILWSIDTLDWKTRNAQSTIQTVLEQVRDGSIVLMHDIHSPSVDAAEILIPKLIQSGYQLVTVSELANYKGIAMKNGSVYSSFSFRGW